MKQQNTSNIKVIPAQATQQLNEAPKNVDRHEVDTFTNQVLDGLEKARYLLQNIMDDYLIPLRYEVDNKLYDKAKNRAFVNIHSAEVLSRIMVDVLLALGETADKFYRDNFVESLKGDE